MLTLTQDFPISPLEGVKSLYELHVQGFLQLRRTSATLPEKISELPSMLSNSSEIHHGIELSDVAGGDLVLEGSGSSFPLQVVSGLGTESAIHHSAMRMLLGVVSHCGHQLRQQREEWKQVYKIIFPGK